MALNSKQLSRTRSYKYQNCIEKWKKDKQRNRAKIQIRIGLTLKTEGVTNSKTKITWWDLKTKTDINEKKKIVTGETTLEIEKIIIRTKINRIEKKSIKIGKWKKVSITKERGREEIEAKIRKWQKNKRIVNLKIKITHSPKRRGNFEIKTITKIENDKIKIRILKIAKIKIKVIRGLTCPKVN